METRLFKCGWVDKERPSGYLSGQKRIVQGGCTIWIWCCRRPKDQEFKVMLRYLSSTRPA